MPLPSVHVLLMAGTLLPKLQRWLMPQELHTEEYPLLQVETQDGPALQVMLEKEGLFQHPEPPVPQEHPPAPDDQQAMPCCFPHTA